MPLSADLTSYKQMRSLVCEIIRDSIINGDLSAGDRINLEQIAAQLNVSRMPIREAIQKLEGEGFVYTRPHRGVFVVSPSKKEIMDTFDARGLLEGFIAREACELLTCQDLAELESVAARSLGSLEGGDIKGLVAGHDQFHAVFLQGARNRVVADMAASLLARSHRLRIYGLTVPETSRKTSYDHVNLVEVLRRRDPNEAEQAFRAHARLSRDIAIQIAFSRCDGAIPEDDFSADLTLPESTACPNEDRKPEI